MRLARARRPMLVGLIALALVACGDNPLESIGVRSSNWINEPTVPTTVVVEDSTPVVVSAEDLLWSNDAIETESLDEADQLLQEIFDRRQGDRFIQASRFEIAAALPDIGFPSEMPTGAEWVSSQLVFQNDGTLSDDPSAAFGVWSAEPYTRSRSVAQMIVLRVSMDLVAATELATGEVAASCARFADRTSDECELIKVGTRDTWVLDESGGATVIWYEGPYRYEMFGRSYVPVRTLQDLSGEMLPLSSIGAASQ